MSKKKVTLSIESKVYDDFQKYCEDNAIMLSKKVEIVMKELLKNKKSLSLFFMIFLALFLINLVSATDISTDNFECGGFSCGSGWSGSWSYSGTCEITSLGGAIGSYHLRGQEGCDATRNFNSASYAQSNVSFWATAQSLEAGDFCYYYYYNGTGYTQLLSLTDGDDDTTHDYYEYDVTNYGLSSSAGIRIESPGVAADYCAIDNITIFGFGVADSTPPTFSSYTETPSNNSAYSSGQFYQFNVTVTETNSINRAGIEFSGANYSVSNSSNVYFFNRTNLAAGTYSYYWWANDTNGNFNTSGVRYYTLAKASQTAVLSINETSPIIYGNWINVTCNGELFRNNLNITSQKGQSILLGAGNYNYSCKLYESQNYSYDDDNSTFVVDPASTITSVLTSPSSPITYPAASNFSCSNSQGLYTEMYINGVNKTSEKGLNAVRAAGNYVVSCNSTGNQNHSASSNQTTYVIDKAAGQVSLLLNGLEDNLTVSYPQQINASASTIYGTVSLYRDGTLVNSENGVNKTLGSEYYNYTAVSSGNENYSLSFLTYFVNVTKGTPVLTFLLNGNPDNATLTYLQNLNASATASGGSANLYRNNVTINGENSVNKILGVNYYTYKANVTGNENYTDGEGIILYVNITKASPSENMDITINPSETVDYGTETNAQASEVNPGDSDLAYRLYRGGTLVSSTFPWFDQQTLNAGTYIYTFNTTGGQNYTSGSVNATLTVNKLGNAISLLLNGIASNLTLNYLQQLNASAYSDSGTVSLYRNSVSVDFENSVNKVLAAGYYEYFANSSGSLNYLENSTGIKFYANINKAIPAASLTNNESWTITYGTSVTIGYSESNNGDGDIVYKVYRDGNDRGSGESVFLGGGEYNYSINTDGGQNYSAASNLDEKTLIVNRKTSSTTLTFDKTSPQIYGTSINATCSSTNNEGELKLYRDGIDVTSAENGKNIILGVGEYSYTCNVTDSQNYTSSSSSGNFSIEKAVGEIKLYLNGFENDLEIVYPQQYNITATTLYGNLTIYFNGTDVTANNGLNVTPGMLETSYNVTAISSGDENHSSVAVTRWLNVTFDSVPPVLYLLSPDGTYGFNESIALEFSVSDNNLESCWYSINDGENISLPDCQNTTINVSGNGEYNLSLFANDSMGNEARANGEFSVSLGAPTIILKSPVNSYLNYYDIVFRYTPSDIDLGSCELWGDFDGTLKYNQTDYLPLNGSDNFFNLTLPDGIYTWNIRCNDSQGHTAFDGNRLFYVDTVNPRIVLSQPSGKKTSRTGIPLEFSVSDNSPVACWYSVYLGESVHIGNTTFNCSQTTTFSVNSDGNFIIIVHANDSAGNANSSSSSFTVDTSTIVSPPSGGGGGGGGGGNGGGGSNTVDSRKRVKLKCPPRKSLKMKANRGIVMKMSTIQDKAKFEPAAKPRAFHIIQPRTATKKKKRGSPRTLLRKGTHFRLLATNTKTPRPMKAAEITSY